eukprot:1157929-Pelagomonas_calceolata.AAC.4
MGAFFECLLGLVYEACTQPIPGSRQASFASVLLRVAEGAPPRTRWDNKGGSWLPPPAPMTLTTQTTVFYVLHTLKHTHTNTPSEGAGGSGGPIPASLDVPPAPLRP